MDEDRDITRDDVIAAIGVLQKRRRECIIHMETSPNGELTKIYKDLRKLYELDKVFRQKEDSQRT